jgi:F0F1-type ATP synthase assembly protein I
VSAVGTKRPRRSWTQLTWSQSQSARAGQDGDERKNAGLARGAGSEVFSYLIAGLLVYGGIGWLIGRAVHIQILFPIGMLVGVALSLGWVVYRYGFKGAGQ